MTVALDVAAATGRDFPRAPNRDLDLRTLADAYMAAYTGRDHSRSLYLGQWIDALGARRLSELDADLIADALEAFARTPARRFLGRDKKTGQARWKTIGLRGPATLNRMKSTLSALLSWAQRRRLAPRGWVNPCREIPATRENNARTRFLSADERERLLRVAKVSSWPKLQLLVLMAITTGARRGELMCLRIRDLDLEAGTAMLATTKNGEPRVLPLTPAVVAEIRRHGLPHPDAYLFASRYRADRPFNIETAWRRALVDARIENFRFHDLRHSCASYLAQSGASLIEIADVLGHRSLDVTRRYAHLTVDNKRQLVQRVLGDIA